LLSANLEIIPKTIPALTLDCAAFSDNEEASDVELEPTSAKKASGRARKPVSYEDVTPEESERVSTDDKNGTADTEEEDEEAGEDDEDLEEEV
jgi:hypothetical protein